MKFTRPPVALIAMVALGLLVGCDSSKTTTSAPTADSVQTDSASESTLVGDIKIDGSSTVQPISDAIREAFIAQHPGVKITVGGEGTGNGFKEFYGKATDISDASRPIKPGELEKAQAAGVKFVELAVAYDGLTIAINPDNDWVKSLTVEQLEKIFVGKDAAKKWKDVDPSWPDQEIKIFSPGTGSGTYDYFKEVVADKQEMRGDMTLNENDNVLVQGVAGNKFSIGFFGVAYYTQNASILKAVPIVNPEINEPVLPTTENIASGKYAPFSRPLFIYVSEESLARAEVQTFVEFYLENVSTFCAEGKVDYVQLPGDLFERTMTIFDDVTTGTHFIDADGNSREGAFAELYVAESLDAK
ncbi:PstS family phosphate ABC transporter substrate-binding protein [Rubripirellula reticaptiva]|uniref:Phosphate-binding protein n=1 Tax=Rubripirellula reticaptiva TaxID=2528013 RepID=A0A5C6EIH6_9BACT|nr:PstS family phosphate ABC transporter substrate-binding protein [Rubripirellula reticaptiva]TWU48304.1 Phosphate-binding protein PstS precursor [Rubripirellula reticaptiva]